MSSKDLRAQRSHLILVAILLWSSLGQAQWEVSVAFLGADEDSDYQSDIDRNVMELARLAPGEALTLSLYRELPDRKYAYYPDPNSTEEHLLSKLVSNYQGKEKIPGKLDEVIGLEAFLKSSFTKEGSRRLLVLYAHGYGYDGLKKISLARLRNLTEGLGLDILWLDACFMGGLEVAAELSKVSRFFVSSEESEFSAGAPFDVLQKTLNENPEETAVELAERFLESYSFAKRGSQTSAVFKSSATISVLDLRKFESLYPTIKAWSLELKKVVEELPAKTKKIRMEKEDLVDFGALLQAFPNSQPAEELKTTLDLGSALARKTNPRLRVEAPKSGSLLVFGYENWKRGNKRDSDVLEKLPEHLTPTDFVDGPRRKKWPSRPVNIRLFLAPFTVGLNRFDFYFADPNTLRALTPRQSYERTQDYITRTAVTEANPLRFTGYTQGVGALAEKYTGLSVLEPGNSVPNLDYIELKFFQETGWANF